MGVYLINLYTEICKPVLKLDFMTRHTMGVPLGIWSSNYTANNCFILIFIKMSILDPNKAVAVCREVVDELHEELDQTSLTIINSLLNS
jgi:hypothetical protein